MDRIIQLNNKSLDKTKRGGTYICHELNPKRVIKGNKLGQKTRKAEKHV